uniref:Uncharacterized protein n=1 Tax=Polytomella parva TaxID=51329 RepID=A0A7S0UWZ7_9CHLO
MDDENAIQSVYKTYAMDRTQWNSEYANAYIKMASTFAKFVDDVDPTKTRFFMDGTECPRGYVVNPMYKNCGSYATKKLSCMTWTGSNNRCNGNKGNMKVPS